jgi:hypothetical protein
MKVLFTLILTLLMLEGVSQKVRIDTVKVYDEKGTTYLTPYRVPVLNVRRKGKKQLYFDPIKVSEQTINKAEKPYYLISFDKNRIKRIEGNYFDQFPNGVAIEYDSVGNKRLEGQFELRLYKKPRTVAKSRIYKLKQKYYSNPIGTWTYFSDNGKIMRREEFNKKSIEITTYDKDGKILKLESVKNKAYKKTKPVQK